MQFSGLPAGGFIGICKGKLKGCEGVQIALEFIKKLVLAWDPDFTKLTPAERASLEEAMADPETVSHDEIDWD